jgi:hypothetical protein
MARSPIQPVVLTEVLVSSRRRCAICFGLNRDTSLKSGQVAHLDHDATNNSPGNLAFLCLEHHDLYDSTTRQSKNITKGEVIAYRDELLTALKEAFSNPSSFGSTATTANRKGKMVDGHYIRVTDGDGSYQSAEIKISRIASKHSQYHISGHALWGKKRPSGPHIGDFDYIMTLDGGAFHHVNSLGGEKAHSIFIKIDGPKLIVKEENWTGAYGMNVNFIGEYQKSD